MGRTSAAAMAEWRRKNPERNRAINKRYWAKHRVQRNKKGQEYRQQSKQEALAHYGKNNTLCCCWLDCNVSDIDVLSLDHINNDGAQDRKARTGRRDWGGANLYSLLRRLGYPAGFQTLCMNHQFKKESLRKQALKLEIINQAISIK